MPVYEQLYYDQLDRIATALESIAGTLIELKEEKQTDSVNPGAVIDRWMERRREQMLAEMNDENPHPHAEGTHNPQDEPVQVDAAAIAREAEELLNAAATPAVNKGVEVGEGEKPVKVLQRINLFKQDRNHDIMDLLDARPHDNILLAFAHRLRSNLPVNSAVEIEGENKVWAAAIELVYTHLPHDMWGGEEAAKAVKQFVAQHSEEQ